MISAGDTLYREQSHVDRFGITWVLVLKATVRDVDQGVIYVDPPVATQYPHHSPPTSWDEIAWEKPPGAQASWFSAAVLGDTWKTAPPTLGEPEVLPESTERDYLRWRSNVYASRETALPEQQVSAEDQRRFLIHEYREGLKAW